MMGLIVSGENTVAEIQRKYSTLYFYSGAGSLFDGVALINTRAGSGSLDCR